ncbi:SnoaL-like domain-containing protein [Chitinophaga sp. Hz27]|uniref:SnoaL-like domain-containing protein n=1 Tax=Chitinophaga sp. Hz27 TaxID=3347169 RepID=UPI0035D63B07
MTTAAIAARLVELCSKGDFEGAQKELYAEDAISIEPYATPAFEKETHGLKAIIEKGHKFDGMVEKYHDISISQPLFAGNSFTVVLQMDLTMKGQDRMQMSEICVYVTKNGKIISEQFFM